MLCAARENDGSMFFCLFVGSWIKKNSFTENPFTLEFGASSLVTSGGVFKKNIRTLFFLVPDLSSDKNMVNFADHNIFLKLYSKYIMACDKQ